MKRLFAWVVTLIAGRRGFRQVGKLSACRLDLVGWTDGGMEPGPFTVTDIAYGDFILVGVRQEVDRAKWRFYPRTLKFIVMDVLGICWYCHRFRCRRHK